MKRDYQWPQSERTAEVAPPERHDSASADAQECFCQLCVSDDSDAAAKHFLEQFETVAEMA